MVVSKRVFIVLLLFVFLVSVPNVMARELVTGSDYMNAARDQVDMGNYDEALKLLYQYRALEPEVADKEWGVSKGIGWVLAKQGRYAEALNEFDITIKNNPDLLNNQGVLYYNRAWVLAKLGRYDDALTSIDLGLTQFPFSSTYWYNKGWILDKLGRYEEATEAYDKSLRYSLVDQDPLGTFKDAARAYDEAQAGVPSLNKPASEFSGTPIGSPTTYGTPSSTQEDYTARDWYRVGYDLYHAQDFEGAIAAFDKAIVLDPNYVMAYYYKGLAYGKMGKYLPALEAHNNTISRLDYHQQLGLYGDAYLMKGWTLAKLNRYNEANTAFDEILRVYPDSFNTMFWKGWVLEKLGQYQESTIWYDKSRLISKRTMIESDIFGILDLLGDYREAAATYDRAGVSKGSSTGNFSPSISKPSQEKVIYSTDFSTDPGWTSSYPKTFYWDDQSKVFRFKSDTSLRYAEVPLKYNKGPFDLQFDLTITHSDPGSYLVFGIANANTTYNERNTITARYENLATNKYRNAKAGSKMIDLKAINDNKFLTKYDAILGDGTDKTAMDFGNDTVYKNTIRFEPQFETIQFQVTNPKFQSHYDVSGILRDVGEFGPMGRLVLVAENSDAGYIEGYIDNIRFAESPQSTQNTGQSTIQQNITDASGTLKANASDLPHPTQTQSKAGLGLPVILAGALIALFIWKGPKK